MGGNKKARLKKVLSAAPSIAPPQDPAEDGLMDDLLAELEARDQKQADQTNNQMENERVEELTGRAPKKNSKIRHKEREMRKAAARLIQQNPEDEVTAMRIKQETEEEEKAIRSICQAENLQINEIAPDGHCLFAAVADQLAFLSIVPPEKATYHTTRAAAAKYIMEHPDDFLPFLVALHDEDAPDVANGAPMSLAELQNYCAAIRDTGAWGGEPEILALARAYNVPIHVVQWGTPAIVVHSPSHSEMSIETTSSHTIRISYHRRMYGLGEHYNSLHPILP